MMLLSRVFRVVPWAGLCLSAACAVGNPGDIPCATHADCPAGKDCHPEKLICVQAEITTNNDPTNGRVVPNSTPNNDAPDMGDDNNSTANNTTNTNSSPNNTVGPTNNTPGCTPACQAPETCVNGQCVLPDCAAVGDPCDPSRPAQGLFTCLDVEGEGICAQPCGRAPSVDTCPSGEYCLSYDGRNVCLPSFCDTNADCTNGTCVHVDNDFYFCLPAGNLGPDAQCDPNDDQCGVGQACDPGTGFCEPLCDPWATSPCASNHFCGVPMTARTAICSHDIDVDAPVAPFVECTDTGSMCDDAVGCFQVDTALSACLKYCRAGMNDCAGVLTAALNPTVCDAYALYEPGLGICWPPCNPADPDPCGPGAVCDNQLCRIPCSPGSEVADCCGGQSPCPAWCNPVTNLCE